MTLISSYHWRLAALGYLGVVVYLTLLPFQFADLSVAEAWEAYRRLEFAAPTQRARQQWVANVLMFLPLGFFWAAWLSAHVRSWPGRVLAALAAFAVAVLTTASVEFVQSWIPGREPSLTDMSANATGGALGVVVWFAVGPRLGVLWERLRSGGQEGLRRGLWLFAITYLLVSLLPFDFLLSVEELRARLDSDLTGLWTAAAGCDGGLRCAALRLAEVVLSAPIGMLLALYLGAAGLAALIPVALALGAAFEVGQFLTYSGVAEGQSVLTRALGILLGAALLLYAPRLPFGQLVARSHWLVIAMAPMYLLALVFINLGGQGFVLDPGGALRQLGSLSFLPFYYHYYVRESVAIASLLAHLAMYAPVGVGVWLWTLQRDAAFGPRAWTAAALALGLALLMEAGKLFMAGLRPDPTTLLIAPVAAWATLWTLTSVARALNVSSLQAGGAAYSARIGTHSAAREPRVPASEGRAARSSLQGTHSWPYLFTGLLLSGAAFFAALQHPIAPAVALFAVVLYMAMLWRWPVVWLVAVPAALPVLDFTPWTGRLFFDEWDLLVLSTLAALSLRTGLVASVRASRPASLMAMGRLWLILFLVSYGAAVAFALWPPAWPQFLDFSDLHSPYNALRLAKGVLWALLLWHFFVRTETGRRPVFEWLALGMVLGLLGAVITVLWERYLFTGLLDFSTVYRVVGMFSSTHTGGAFLEAYLVTAVPFLAMALAWRPRGWWRTFAAILFLLAAYAVAVTFARAGYAGLLVAVAVTAVAAGLRFGVALRARVLALLGMLVVVAAGLALLDYVKQDEFMSQRVDAEQIRDDWGTRVDHWRQALEPVFADNRSAWLGLGVGRFPAVNFWESVLQEHARVAAYAMNAGPDGVTLVLTPGRSLFFWQAVPVEPQSEYRVTVLAEGGGERPRLGVYLCEKWVLYSRRCDKRRLDFDAGAGLEARETVVQAPAQRTSHGIFERPSKLILYNASRDDSMAIASVSMLDPSGRELLANNDFSKGMDRWFFTSDDHLAWHVKNLWAQVLFEQGWTGVVLWTLLVFTALWSAGRKALDSGAGATAGAILLASLLSLLTVGMFDSLFDAPRMATLFFLLLMLALVRRSDWPMLAATQPPRPRAT